MKFLRLALVALLLTSCGKVNTVANDQYPILFTNRENDIHIPDEDGFPPIVTAKNAAIKPTGRNDFVVIAGGPKLPTILTIKTNKTTTKYYKNVILPTPEISVFGANNDTIYTSKLKESVWVHPRLETEYKCKLTLLRYDIIRISKAREMERVRVFKSYQHPVIFNRAEAGDIYIFTNAMVEVSGYNRILKSHDKVYFVK